MPRKFCYQVYLDEHRYVFLQDLSFSLYKEFLKVILDYNLPVVNFFIDEVLRACFVKGNFDFDPSELDIIDKSILLLSIKSYSVASDVKFKVTCSETEKTFDFVVYINDLIDFLRNANIQKRFSVEDNIMSLSFKLPTTFKKHAPGDLIAHYIESITYKDTIIKDFTGTDFISKLPVSVVSKFNAIFNEQNDRLLSAPIISYRSPFVEGDGITDLFVSLLDDSLLSTIKLIFETDLLDLYETEYFLIKDYNFTQDLFESKSPADIFAYIAIIGKYKEEESDSSQSGIPPEELYTGAAELENM